MNRRTFFSRLPDDTLSTRDILILLVSSLALAQCQKPSQEEARRNVEEDIYETVFSDILSESSVDSVYFLAILTTPSPDKRPVRTDPPAQLMRRLSDNVHRLGLLSQCIVDSNVTDKGSGEKGHLCTVGPIIWISDDEVEVLSHVFPGNLARKNSIQRVSGKWTIIRRFRIYTVPYA